MKLKCLILLKFCFLLGYVPPKTLKEAKSRSWNDDKAKTLCEKFYCFYENCKWDLDGFVTKATFNAHLLHHHWYDYILERQANLPLRSLGKLTFAINAQRAHAKRKLIWIDSLKIFNVEVVRPFT